MGVHHFLVVARLGRIQNYELETGCEGFETYRYGDTSLIAFIALFPQVILVQN